VDLVSICGGVGTCGRCKVQVITGNATPVTIDEQDALTSDELDADYRLACQAHPLGDIKLHVPPESLTAPQRTQVEGLAVPIETDPVVRPYEVALPPASLADLRADDERLVSALSHDHGVQVHAIDLDVLRGLSARLRESGWRARVAVRGREIIAPLKAGARLAGFAADIGSTKIAGYLVDLENGHTLAAQGIMNPQIAYGEDIIARIAAAGRAPAEAQRLQKLVIDALNQLIADLCAEASVKPAEVLEAVLVGNTAIHHLTVQLPVQQLAQAPYVPCVRTSLDLKARDLGLEIAAGGYVHFLPNVAGYVGADHVAMLLATQIQQQGGTVLALDIGTNTEICLAAGGKMASVSCPSGPAFEGAHIKFGMRAAAGAIEHVEVEGGEVKYQTIGGVAPVGVCGSGILDAVAQMHLNGALDRTGRMVEHPRVRTQDGVAEFVLVWEQERGGLPAIAITQRDVRQLQLAKGAIRTGIQVLVEASGKKESDIDHIIIAGAFGTYIDVGSAIALGMLPPLPLERFKQVGNAAGAGARLALMSRAKRQEAQRLAANDGYIELAGMPGFDRKFAQAMYFGPATD
jgi:uncharacterized 2Fe-2S/4Fe-4S cluster protein (DUF4445 family)